MRWMAFILIAPLLLTSCDLSILENATYTPTVTATWLPGDLGWGSISGVVRDSTTDTPIQGATVTCEHSSYTSPATCHGSATTDASGIFTFNEIFFHDTDRIKLWMTATGYHSQFYEFDSLDQPELSMDAYMLPTDYTPMIMCTPPPCAIGTSEVYQCSSGDCPGGCGTSCATYTPTP